METLKARVPHRYTVEELEVVTSRGEKKILPARSFITVMDLRHLPRDYEQNWNSFSPKIEAICYTSFGYCKIPLNKIESTDN
jgi:hypothetical protein